MKSPNEKFAEVMVSRLAECNQPKGMEMITHETLLNVIGNAISVAQDRGEDAGKAAIEAAKAFKAGLAAYTGKEEDVNAEEIFDRILASHKAVKKLPSPLRKVSKAASKGKSRR